MQRSAYLPALAWMLSFAPSTASACWDGHAAAYGNVTVQGGDAEWSPEQARSLALWLPRLSALVGDKELEISFNSAFFGDAELVFPTGRLDLLFARIARKLEIARDERRAAMRAGVEAMTVQVAATRERGSAEALARRLAESDPGYDSGEFAAVHGFYEAGGFPADNSPLHIVETQAESGAPLFLVVVGAFLDRAEAEEVVESMRSAHGGLEPYVRRL